MKKNSLLTLLVLWITVLLTSFSISAQASENTYSYFDNYLDRLTLPSKEVTVGTTGHIRPLSDSIVKNFKYAFRYEVSDPNILSIDNEGKWVALKAGTVILTVENHYPNDSSSEFKAELMQYGVSWDNDDTIPTVVRYAAHEEITITDKSIPPKTNLLTVIGIYRLYHPERGIHTYIKGDGERSRLEQRGWRYEGTAWRSAVNVNEINRPVYRLYSMKKDAYIYTLHTTEVDKLKAAGWRYEGIAFQSTGRKPVYRLYNKKAGIHFYTANPAERDKLKSSTNYRYEGFAWYSE